MVIVIKGQAMLKIKAFLEGDEEVLQQGNTESIQVLEYTY